VNIINNLKNEISQLKQQISTKNKTITINENIINNNKSTSNSIEKNKEKNNEKNIDNENNNNNSTFFGNEDKFIENIKEIKELIRNQLAVKQKIITTKNEINKLSEIIEMNKDISTINNGISFLINKADGNKDKEKMQDGPKKNIDNNTNQILDDENDENSKLNHLKEKMDTFQKKLLENQNRFKEIDNIIDKVISISCNKYNYSEIQKEIFNTFLKNSNYKNQLIDNKFNNLLNKTKNDIKDEYIKELEKQIEYRDEIMKEFSINVQNSKLSTVIKELENLKNEFKNKMEKAYLSQNLPLFQITNNNNPIPYNNSLTNPNNIYLDQVYNTNSTINNISKRSGTQSRKKANNIIINKNIKNANNNRIPSNYIRGSGTSSGLVKNSSCTKIVTKKFQNNSNNIMFSNKSGGNANIMPNTGNGLIPLQFSNKIFGKGNTNNINSLKRNPKSYVCNNNNNINKEHINYLNFNSEKTKKNEKTKRHKSAIGVLNGHNGHNSSYNEEDYYYICNKNNFKYWSDRLMTAEEIPQFKKSDINNKINEKNLKRQKFLDRINSDIKEIL
jgi:hypothetical protein